MTDKTNETTLIPVFVYGTLRPGAVGASGLLASATVAGPWLAHTTGRLCYHECGAYPVADYDGTGIVRGDMMLVPEDSPAWRWIANMEVRAGYVPRVVEVCAQQTTGEWRRANALTFHWPHGTDGLAPVPAGDWHLAEPAEWPEDVD